MKKLSIIMLLTITVVLVNAQTQYDNIGHFGEFKPDWALVHLDNKLGFINKKGEEVVIPTYDKIEHFGEFKSDRAVVYLNGKKGFIDLNGNYISGN